MTSLSASALSSHNGVGADASPGRDDDYLQFPRENGIFFLCCGYKSVMGTLIDLECLRLLTLSAPLWKLLEN